MNFITILKNVNIHIGLNWIYIKGSHGFLVKKKTEDTFIFKKLNRIYIFNKDKKQQELLILRLNDLMLGVSFGFILKLRLVGIGFKINIEKNLLTLRLGFSHEIIYEIPENIKIFQPKLKIPVFFVFGTEKEKVNQVAAEIRFLKQPEPYKGKGICFKKENILRKEGKKSNV